jgi:general secretion pathway protein M
VELDRLKELFFEYFSSLSDREKGVIAVGVPLLIVFLYVLIVLVPILSQKETYERRKELLIKKTSNLKSQVEELYCLKRELKPIEEKLRRGANLDVPSFLKTVSRMVGLRIDKVQIQPGETYEDYERDKVLVKFSQVELNKVTRFINSLERSSYHFKSDSISVSDFDGDGLVSGKVTFLFFRRVK